MAEQNHTARCRTLRGLTRRVRIAWIVSLAIRSALEGLWAAETCRISVKAPVAISFDFSAARRDVVEADDRYHIPGTSGEARITKTMAETACALPGQLAVDIKFGFAKVALEGFSETAYNSSFDAHPAWGFGVRRPLGFVRPYLVEFDLRFDYWRFKQSRKDREAEVEEWRACIAAAQRWPMWRWECGPRYSDATIVYEHPVAFGVRQGRYESTENWGVFGAVSWLLSPRLEARAALSLVDVSGVELGLIYTF